MAQVKERGRGISAAQPEGRMMPHNNEAEQALLGSMFLSVEAAETALMKITTEDFYRPAHKRIFAAIEHLYEKREAIDQVTVADRLEATGELEAAGGKTYLLDVTSAVPTAANAAYYAEIVARTSTLRSLIDAGTHIVSMGFEAPDDLGVVIEEAEKAIFEVTSRRITGDFRKIDKLLKEGFKHLEELFAQQKHITGVPTGFEDLDRLLTGLHRGDLVVLAARPSVGKTALALNIGVNAAKQGHPVAIFSLEMSSEQLVQRILCSEARIDSQRLRSGTLRETDWPLINQAMGRLADCDVYVDDTASSSILEIRAKARRLFRDKMEGLIIVDYLQLMQPQHRRSENRQTEIADISRGLKILAKELDVPIIAISQLSREVEKRAGKRPQLSDLRESGAIEQDADVVMFIHRDVMGRSTDEEGHQLPPKGEAEIIVAKHRNGPVDTHPGRLPQRVHEVLQHGADDVRRDGAAFVRVP